MKIFISKSFFFKDKNGTAKSHHSRPKYFGSSKPENDSTTTTTTTPLSPSSSRNSGEKAFKKIISGKKKLPGKFTFKEKKSSPNGPSSSSSSSLTITNDPPPNNKLTISSSLMDTSFGSQSDLLTASVSSSLRQVDDHCYVNTQSNAPTTTTTSNQETSNNSINNKGGGVMLGQAQRREVTLYRDDNLGFGFIAGSEKPLKIRFVTPGSCVCVCVFGIKFFVENYYLKLTI